MAKLYELEQHIMGCWNVTNDLDVIAGHAIDGNEMSPDDIWNVLAGIKALYEIRFNNLFEAYEAVLKENRPTPAE